MVRNRVLKLFCVYLAVLVLSNHLTACGPKGSSSSSPAGAASPLVSAQSPAAPVSLGQANEGGIATGGGTGFTLPDGSVHLLDTYEAQNSGIRLELGSSSESAAERMPHILQRISAVAPARAALYREWYSSFFQETQWIDNSQKIDNPSDLSGVILPANASLVQLCFQRHGIQITGHTQKRYVINKSLYDQLSVDDQLVLIFHELVYRDVLSLTSGNSNQVRYLTEQLLSEGFNWHKYVTLMTSKIWFDNEFMGVLVPDPRRKDEPNLTSKISYYSDGNLCQLDEPSELVRFPLNNKTIPLLQNLNYIPQTLTAEQKTNQYGQLENYISINKMPETLTNCQLVSHPSSKFSISSVTRFDLPLGDGSSDDGAIKAEKTLSVSRSNQYSMSHGNREVDELNPRFEAWNFEDLHYYEQQNENPESELFVASGGTLRFFKRTLATGNVNLTLALTGVKIKLRSGQGFDMGSITLEKDKFASKWMITSVVIIDAGNLTSPIEGGLVHPLSFYQK